MAGKNQSSQPKVVVYRKSTNGEFTTKQYAQKHPNTTEKETYKKS